MRKDSTTPSKTAKPKSDAPDVEVEGNPEVIELKKKLRKAELRKQIAEVEAPINMGSRLVALEEQVEYVFDVLVEVLGEDYI